MAEEDKGGRLKSAYELALERLESQGIGRPDEGKLSPDERQQVAELRRRTEAKLAELEILHRDRLRKTGDPHARRQLEEEYASERQRLEESLERQLARRRGPEQQAP